MFFAPHTLARIINAMCTAIQTHAESKFHSRAFTVANLMNLNELPYIGSTESEEGTENLAVDFATWVHPGDVVLLQGDLGAGKTRFVRGLCQGLGMSELWEVDSPTYTVVNHYDVADGVDHIDLYRLTSEGELDEIGFDDMLRSASIVIVEWPERLGSYPLPPSPWVIHIHILEQHHIIGPQ